MKTIDELGISPTPWSREIGECGTVFNSTFEIVATIDADSKIEKESNTNLIAAAPDLYRSLREAVVESCVSYCGEHPIHCHKKDGECFVQKWRDVLAKASGEEVSK